VRMHRSLRPLVGVAALAAALSLPGVRTAAQQSALARVDFNFDQVEIRLLAKMVGEMTGRRLVVDDKVTGKVTVVTPQEITIDEVFPLFVSILESSGYSVMEKDGSYHVVALAESASPVAPVVGADQPARGDGIITKVFKLEHISAVEVMRALEAMVRGSKEGSVAAVGTTNHLIITDTANSIRRLGEIIEELDRPGASRSLDYVQLEYGSAHDIAAQVMAAINGAESAGNALSRQMRQVTEGAGSLPQGFTAIPSQQANSIVMVGTPVQLSEAKRLIEIMDVESPKGTGRLNAIFLNHIKAEEAAKNLNALLERRTAKDSTQQVISVEPNVSNNALIVDATPHDFELVRDLVTDLDRVPQQVLVEILIAEVAMGNNVDLGVELSTIDETQGGSTVVVGRSRPGESDTIIDSIAQGTFPQGLSIGVARGAAIDINGLLIPSIPVLINALAEDRDVRIVSNIPLLAQDNKEAEASIVENIPVLTSTIEGGSGTARDVIQNIERIDVGVKLKFTPHVNPNGEVLMDLNPSIEAVIDESNPDAPFTPTISKREVKTTVTVPDRQTIVISGLIREDNIKQVFKTPLLGDIPILGHLFRHTSSRKQRTNLLIMVTPHIVTDLDAAREIQQRLESQTSLEGITNAFRQAGALILE